jgi:hypothetical protein
MMWTVGCRKWMLSGVDNHAVVIFGAQQLAQQQPDHFAVAHQVARVLERPRLVRVEQRADDDRTAREAACLGDKGGVGALPRAGRAAQQDDLLRKAQTFAADLGGEVLPDRLEDQLRVFDLQRVELGPGQAGALLVHEIGLAQEDVAGGAGPLRSAPTLERTPRKRKLETQG